MLSTKSVTGLVALVLAVLEPDVFAIALTKVIGADTASGLGFAIVNVTFSIRVKAWRSEIPITGPIIVRDAQYDGA